VENVSLGSCEAAVFTVTVPRRLLILLSASDHVTSALIHRVSYKYRTMDNIDYVYVVYIIHDRTCCSLAYGVDIPPCMIPTPPPPTLTHIHLVY